jgi:DMSO/TMAO reductase YedYZ molybdopterin-dependent catalytic subunit
LFYVRNHGAVPKVDEELAANWKIEVTGQVKNPIELSIRDLKERFKVVTLPVTLVCAGSEYGVASNRLVLSGIRADTSSNVTRDVQTGGKNKTS